MLTTLIDSIKEAGKDYVVVLLSEIFPNKLEMFDDVDAWVQVRPRRAGRSPPAPKDASVVLTLCTTPPSH